MLTNSHSSDEHYLISSKIELFYDLLSCNYSIPHWCYGSDGHLISSSSPDSRILDTLFSVSEAKKYMIEYGKEHTMPLVISSSLGNVWFVITEPVDDYCLFHVLGPLFTDAISKAAITKRLNAFRIPLNWKANFEQLITNFPAVPWNIICQYAIMLHYITTNERISISDFSYHSIQGTAKQSNNPPISASPTDSDTRDKEKDSLVWGIEQALLNNIREGNLNYHKALSLAMSSSSGVNIKAGNPLRQAQDSGIVFCALCARAAINGGLSAETAYTIQNIYSQNIESASTVSDVASINHQMYVDFIARVHKIKEASANSLQIRRCIEYIQLNISSDIDIQTLADRIGYSDYYLTRKFKKEIGMSINQYIRQEKLKVAQHLLCETNMSVQEISDRLSFCSRSYFTDVFCKTFGVTPTDYRASNQQ